MKTYALALAATALLAGIGTARPCWATLQDERFLVTEPEWAPDGQRIAFAGGAWPDLDVYVLGADSGDAARLFGGDSTDYMPSWSPDGQRIVFASTRSGSHDLYVGPSAGGDVVRITTEDACS